LQALLKATPVTATQKLFKELAQRQFHNALRLIYHPD